MYELIVIGAGPAGITAAVYAARKKMSFLVITKDVGGQAAWSGDVENYTGYQFITGPELAAEFEQHMKKFSIDLREGEEVTAVEKDGAGFVVRSPQGEYRAHSLIIASGKRPRRLNVPGEEEFRNKGVTYCATCDGPLFSGKRVAVIGGGNSALDAALQLVKIAEHIYVINISGGLGGDEVMREKVEANDKVTVMNESRVRGIEGETFVTSLTVERAGKAERIVAEGVFVEIGLIPNSEFIALVAKNELGEIVVNNRNETDVPGIFAAGDVTDVPEKQIIIAAGEGSKATLGAFRYLAGL
ncbi:MAG: FAD-dependent oxidoreductase [Candidatus Omnitrophica bacterium]|nr:FAD-dependent oxidoreductase [Candidatus Omnitrophota bacterium]